MPCSTPIRVFLIAVLVGCPLICHLDIATAEGEVEHCCDCAESPSEPADSCPDDSDDGCPFRNCLCGGAVLGNLCPKVLPSMPTLSPVFGTPVMDLFGATSAQTRVAWTTPGCRLSMATQTSDCPTRSTSPLLASRASTSSFHIVVRRPVVPMARIGGN